MRLLAPSRVAAAAICVALTIGAAGPAFADVNDSPLAARSLAAQVSDPDSAALLEKADSLSGLGEAVDPVSDLMERALKAEKGPIPAAEAEELEADIEEALAEVRRHLPATPATPPKAAPGAAPEAAPTDVVDDTLAALEKALDALLDGLLKGDPLGVVDLVKGTLDPLLDLITGVVDGILPGTAPAAPASPSVKPPTI